MSITHESAEVIWVVVPAKSFQRAKSRLAPALDEISRAQLAERMLVHVLETARRCKRIQHALVVTDGDDVAAVAERCAARVVRDPAPACGLAEVVDAGLIAAQGSGASAALVLMGDLPELTEIDLAVLLAALDDADVVLAPDRSGAHTNALALRLAHGFETAFGDPRSLAQHRTRAEQLGLRVAQVDRAGLTRDVDDPSDLPDCAELPGLSPAPAPKNA